MRRDTKLLAGKTNGNDDSQWLPLWMHCRDTAGVMSLLVQNWLPIATIKNAGLAEGMFLKTARFLGYVHDIGKATALFQSQILSSIPGARVRLENKSGLTIPARFIEWKAPHSCASEAILLHLNCPESLASVAGAHHGKPQEYSSLNWAVDQIESLHSKNFLGMTPELWYAVWDDLFQEALKISGFQEISELPILTEPAMLILTGLLTMADWLSSNTAYFPLLEIEELGHEELYPSRIETAWEMIDLTSPWTPCCYFIDPDGFSKKFDFSPNEIQQSLLEIASDAKTPGLMILEAPMGSGKTEAALGAAEILASRFEEGGLFFGLPTQATTNGIFLRLERWAEKQSEEMAHSVKLAHGAANFNEDYAALANGQSIVDQFGEESGLIVHNWFQGSKRALLADFVIGTVDQLLLAALSQKHVMLRHLGLAGKVVIVDECHAYDAYMNRYLDRILAWLGSYRVPVILLSATLPAQRRTELVEAYQNCLSLPNGDWKFSRDYPLITWTEGSSVKQKAVHWDQPQRQVALQSVTQEDLPALLQKTADAGGCAGIIVNTVSKAQCLTAALRERFPECEVLLFHSQFLLTDRAEKEQQLLERLGKNSTPSLRKRLIVVGTQVLEQSLDIDFDFLITELCPMDLLLQRIGRLHRHNRVRPPELQEATCAVLDAGNCAFDSGSVAVYGEWLLWRTRELLPAVIQLPGDISKLVQDTYEWDQTDRLPETTDSISFRKKYCDAQQIKKQRANEFSIPAPDDRDSLVNWMVREGANSDAQARAAVRDGDPSIEVLVMVRQRDGTVHFLPWQESGREVNRDSVPSFEDAGKIIRQRLRLPGYFGKAWTIDRIIKELENINRELLPMWQLSPVLKGELILLFDEKLDTHLAGTYLHYDQQDGLTYCKEDDCEGNRI